MAEESNPTLSEESPLIQGKEDEEELKKQAKKKKYMIIGGLVLAFIVLTVISLVFFVPLIAASLMQKFADSADLIIEQVELFGQRGRFCDVRIQARLIHNAPVDGEVRSEPALLDVYVVNFYDKTKIEKVGVLTLPSLYAFEKETFFNETCVVEITNEVALHYFISDAINSTELVIFGKGSVKVEASVLFYKHLTATLDIDREVSVLGFKNMDFTLNYMDLIWGKEDEVSINFDITIHNPSFLYSTIPFSVYAQDLGIYYNDTWVGYCTPDNITVGYISQDNKLLGSLVRNEFNEAHIAEFLSRYILGDFVNIYVKGTAKLDCGFPHTPDNPAEFFIQWLLPGIQDELIMELFAPISEVEYFPRLTLHAEGLMFNPLEFPVELLEVDFDGYVGDPCNKTMGHIHEEYDPPFVLPSKNPICLTGLALSVPIADATCMLEGGVFRGIILYAQQGSMVMKVELFQIRIPFEYGPLVGNIGKCRD